MGKFSKDQVVFCILRKKPALDHTFEEKKIIWYEEVQDEHQVLDSKDQPTNLTEKVKKKREFSSPGLEGKYSEDPHNVALFIMMYEKNLKTQLGIDLNKDAYGDDATEAFDFC